MSKAVDLILLVTVLSLAACMIQAPPAKPSAPFLTLDALKNAEYPAEYLTNGKAKLTDGKYEEPNFKALVTLDPAIAWGDLNSDGNEDAAVVLVSNTGGSSAFYTLKPSSIKMDDPSQ